MGGIVNTGMVVAKCSGHMTWHAARVTARRGQLDGGVSRREESWSGRQREVGACWRSLCCGRCAGVDLQHSDLVVQRTLVSVRRNPHCLHRISSLTTRWPIRGFGSTSWRCCQTSTLSTEASVFSVRRGRLHSVQPSLGMSGRVRSVRYSRQWRSFCRG